MTVMLYGLLSDAQVKTHLAKAQEDPSKWAIYLVEEDGRQRTAAQNRLYQRLLRKFAQQQGRTVKYWHNYLVERFLGFEEIDTEDGFTRTVLTSTASLTVQEFTSFLNACLSLASDFHIR